MSSNVSTPKKGYDSWVDQGNQHTEHGSGDWVQMQSGTKRGYLWLPIPAEAMGKTVASAILTVRAHGALAAQTITVQAVAARWEAGKLNWANQPGVVGSTASGTIGALADGASIPIDITALVNAITAGTVTHYGWRVTTGYSTSAQKLAAFNSGQPSWTLAIEYPDDPEPPSVLAPSGTVVAAAKPVVTCDFTDYGDDSSEMGGARIQVDIGNNGSTDWDSGWISAVAPIFDLAALGMTGTVTAGTVVAYRIAVEDGDGNQSDFSDWTLYTYQPQPTLTIDAPAGSSIYDPTTDVLAHISTSLLAAYRVLITDANDSTQVRYDSGKRSANDPSNIAQALPLLNSDFSRIFTDDTSYKIIVRAWDTYDRQATPAAAGGGRLPTYVEQVRTVTFTDDGTRPAIHSFTATQVGVTPFVQLAWSDATTGDAYSITRDGVHIARVQPADVVTGSGGGFTNYAWVDAGASPRILHTYKVRRITSSTGRSNPLTATVTTAVENVWLMRSNGDSVGFKGLPSDQLTIGERRATYKPLHVPKTLSVLTAFEGISGPFDQLWVDDDFGSVQTVASARTVMNAIKSNTGEVVQLIFGAFSKPVTVTDVTFLPASDYTPGNNKHRVAFNVSQAGDFDYRLTAGGS